MRRTALLVPVCVLLAGLTGCGGGDDSPTVTRPTPSPKPTALTVKEAGRAYLRIVKPLNDAIDALNEAGARSNPDISEINRTAGVAAKVDRKFSQQLQSIRWPASARRAVDRLVVDVAREIAILRDIADAQSFGEMQDAFTRFGRLEIAGDAELVRQKLGLPSAPRERNRKSPSPVAA